MKNDSYYVPYYLGIVIVININYHTRSAVFNNLVSCDLSSFQKNLLEAKRSGLTLSEFIYFLNNIMKLDSGLPNSSSFSL